MNSAHKNTKSQKWKQAINSKYIVLNLPFHNSFKCAFIYFLTIQVKFLFNPFI